MSRALTTTPFRRTILLVVAVALLLSQALGLMHRMVHAPDVGHAAHAAHVVNHVGSGAFAAHLQAAELGALALRGAHATDEAAHGADCEHWLERLFATHDADACASYDQLAHADFLWSVPPQLAFAAVTTALRSCHPAWHLAAQAAGYLARGPPGLA